MNQLLCFVLLEDISSKTSLRGQGSLADGRGVGRRQLLCGNGRGQGGLQVDGLVKQLVADQHNQGEKAQLEVVKLSWRLSFISTDDEQREKDGEQTATDYI